MTPTATLTPTSEPESGAILYEDDFSDLSSGWEEGDFDEGAVGYGEGVYVVTATEEDNMMWAFGPVSYEDMVIRVETIQVSAPPNDNNGYGVFCRLQEDDDGYALRISGDGYYAIHLIEDGEFIDLVDWRRSDAIRQGNASNTIVAECEGTALSLTVNGVLVAEVEDDTFASGSVGFTATSFEPESTEIHFDDLVVTAP